MNICRHCGAEQLPYAQFCGSCGHFFSTNTTKSPSSSALSYVTVKSNPPYSIEQAYISNSAYDTILDVAQTSQTPPPPPLSLPPQQAFDGTPLLYKENEEEDEHGLLFLSLPAHNKSVPGASQPPRMNEGSVTHNAPPANAAPAPPVPPAPSVPSTANKQMQKMHVKKPERIAKPLHCSRTLFSPIPIVRPHAHPHHAPGYALRPYILIITLFLAALIIVGTCLTLIIVTPPSLEVSGGSNVRPGDTLHLHGNWYTPESKILLLLDETIPLSAQHRGTPTTSYTRTGNTLSTASNMLTQASTSDNNIVVGITGSFDATISVGADWKAGKHTIRALEQDGKRSATTDITVSMLSHLASIAPSTVILGPVTEGDTQAVSTQVTLGTVGTRLVTWTAMWDTHAAPWLHLNSTSDSIQAPNTQNITVSANPQKLKAGSYSATVTFNDTAGGKSFSLPVSLTIQPNKATKPALSSINPNTLEFHNIVAGSDQPVTQTLTLSTAGKGDVKWQVTWNQQANTWLQLDRSGATISAPDSQQVTVSIQPQGLTPGHYIATMTFTSPQNDKPLTVTVNVTVQSQADLSAISPRTVSLGPVTEGYSQPTTAQVTLSTSGTGNVQWQAYWNKNANPWLQLDRVYDSIQAPTTETIIVGTVAGMKAGVYSATVNFTNSQSGNTVSLMVNFTVRSATAPGEISSVTPATVTLGPVTEGYQQGVTTQVTLNTSGLGTVPWTASYDNKQGNWLLLPTSGQIQAPSSQSITLSTATGMKAGTYTTNVNFTNAQSNKTVSLAVTFIVQGVPPAWSGVSPNPLTLTTTMQGYSQPISAQATLSATGSGTLAWTASSSASWLSVSNATGQIQAPGTQTVSVTAATGLQAGSYSGNITFTDTHSGKQLTLAVSFTVQAPPQLGINTNTLAVNTDCSARRTGWICYVTLTNLSTTDNLIWTSSSINSGTTSITVLPTTNTYTLAAGQSQRVQISIAVKQSSAFNDTVTFSGPGNSQIVTINYTPAT